MADEKTDDGQAGGKAAYEPPAGAETTATWTGGATPIDYTASAKWLVLRKKEKPAAEIFSVSYVADGGDADRPVMFVFNGGPGASSAYLHLGVVGPQRVAFPADGTLPEMPPRLVQNEDVVARVRRPRVRRPGRHRLQPRDRAASRRTTAEGQGQEGGRDRSEGVLRAAARPRVALRVHGPLALGAADAGARRSSSPARATAATASAASCACCRRAPGIGLNGAILISPALELTSLLPNDYDVLAWVDVLPTMAAAAAHHGRSRVFPAGAPLEDVLARGRGVRDRRLRLVPDARRLTGFRRA